MAYRMYWTPKYGSIEKSIEVSSREQGERLVRTMEMYGDTARLVEEE
jgi:transcriptional regulator of NAD metabolism